MRPGRRCRRDWRKICRFSVGGEVVVDPLAVADDAHPRPIAGWIGPPGFAPGSPSCRSPRLGRERPPIIRSRVVLPAPLRPSRAVMVPRPTSKLTSRTAAKSPKYFHTSRTEIAAALHVLAAPRAAVATGRRKSAARPKACPRQDCRGACQGRIGLFRVKGEEAQGEHGGSEPKDPVEFFGDGGGDDFNRHCRRRNRPRLPCRLRLNSPTCPGPRSDAVASAAARKLVDRRLGAGLLAQRDQPVGLERYSRRYRDARLEPIIEHAAFKLGALGEGHQVGQIDAVFAGLERKIDLVDVLFARWASRRCAAACAAGRPCAPARCPWPRAEDRSAACPFRRRGRCAAGRCC